ncbi:MAG: HNH endonuclease family protein [Nocardioides sp.]|nr:HNH endonuclease family protein [Nocardioides sp.]
MLRTCLARFSSLASILVAAVVMLTGVPVAALADDYSAPLDTAISDLPVATESRSGYERDKFKHWIDEDGDGCDTRDEVLLEEADEPPTKSGSCSLSGGRWFSFYDRVSWTDTSDIDIDHMVPLAETWDSGASTWSAATREAYANDLGDYRTLVGVTDNVNQQKSDQDIAEWLPEYAQCQYLRQFVAVKHRWGLHVDSAEKTAMQDLADTCENITISVTLAR